MYLTHIVRSLRDGLDGKLLQRHLLHDDLLQRLDGGIHWAVARCGCLELLTRDVKTDRSHTLHALTRRYLQEVETYGVRICHIGTCQHQGIGISHLLLLVGQNQELLIDLIKLLLLKVYTVHVQTVLQGSSTIELSSIPTSFGSMIS